MFWGESSLTYTKSSIW